MDTCKAAVFIGAGKPLEVWDVPMQEVLPGAVLVRMEMAAICGSDVSAWQKAETPHPMIFGHENIGTVAALGEGPHRDVLGHGLEIGDRIIFKKAACGRCYECANGESCRAAEPYGYRPFREPPHLRGGFGQYLYLDPGSFILRVPDDMSTERALVAVIGNHTVNNGIERIGGIGLGSTVVVQGSGPIGLGALVQTKAAGAQSVILIGAPRHRLELGMEMGADATIDIEEHPRPEDRVGRVRELTGGRGADVVIECSGASTAAREGLEMLRIGGRYLLVGLGQTPVDANVIVRKQLRVCGVTGASPGSIMRSVAAMHRTITAPVEKLITHHFPLERINEGFQAHHSLEATIAVVHPNGDSA